jgi:threonine dehydratase
MFTLSIDSIHQAQARIRPYVRHTPLLPLPALRGDLHPALRLKLENLQVTGSFKPRGVFNNLLSTTPEARAAGVVTASGGNHGVALAYAAHVLGLPATVYLPDTASADRVARVERWGAQVVRHGRNWDDAHAAASAYAAQHNLPYVHPFEAERTLAGQGTLGLEILADAPETDCVLIASGGGGLIGGAAAALKALKPALTVIGVEPLGAPTLLRALEAGRVVELAEVRTIADTLAPRAVGERTLALVQQFVDAVVLVSDDAMIDAMRWLWLEGNQLVEPSGAAVIAALQTGAADIQRFAHPVAVICGGNAAAGPVFAAYDAMAAQLAPRPGA